METINKDFTLFFSRRTNVNLQVLALDHQLPRQTTPEHCSIIVSLDLAMSLDDQALVLKMIIAEFPGFNDLSL